MRRPNILFLICDDHAANAISTCGSVLDQTLIIDRLATEGARLDHLRRHKFDLHAVTRRDRDRDV